MSYRHHSSASRTRRKRFFWIGIGVVAIIIVAAAIPITISLIGNVTTGTKTAYQAPPPPPPPDWSSYFASTTLQAKAAYVVDLSNGQTLYSKNATQALPLASITKLMMTATALDSAPTTTIVEVTKSAIEQGWNGLYVGERWRLGDLLRFTLVVSANGGATAVAQNIGALLRDPSAIATQTHLDTASTSATLAVPDAAVLIAQASSTGLEDDQALFVQKMNDLAATISLSTASFLNPNGLDINATTAGAYASAEDVSKLLIYLSTHYPDIMNATRFPSITVSSLSNLSHTGKNTDILSLQGLDLIASKTGYTDLAGGNLAIIANIDNHPVVIVALGSTEDSRFTDVAALASSSAAVIAAGG